MGKSGREGERSKRKGRPLKLTPDQVEELKELVRENPLLSLDDLVWAFRRRTGVSISGATAGRYLRDAGFKRTRPTKGRRTAIREIRPGTRVG